MSESPAVVLRQAAARVRATAAACEPSVVGLRGVPWHTEEFAVDLSSRAVAQETQAPDGRTLGRYIAEAATPELAAWIALMHTGLAEPLAAWLEAVAAEMTVVDGTEYQAYDEGENEYDSWNAALAVARIILGTKETTDA